jgi:hypothetical protein
MATAKKAAKRAAPARKRSKPAAKPAPKPAAKPAAGPVAGKKAKPAGKTKAAKPASGVVKTAAIPQGEKPRKPKLVRDSFTIPKVEYTVLEALKARAAGLGRPTKKSEVLRAGVMALAAMSDASFLASVGAVPAVKTGRPAKD